MHVDASASRASEKPTHGGWFNNTELMFAMDIIADLEAEKPAYGSKSTSQQR